MNKFLIGTVSLITLAGVIFTDTANAADPAQPGMSYAHDWTGWYWGLKGGFGSGDAVLTNPAPNTTGDYTIDGGLFGTMSGYNFQSGNIVFGIDMDSAFTNIEGITSPANPCGSCSTQLNWLSTVRGRVGVAMDNVLPFVTAGVAFGEAEVTIPGAGGGVDDGILVGYAVGAGLDWAFAEDWTARFEYQYVDLGDKTFNYPGGPTTVDISELHLFRIGVSTDITRFFRSY